jgi:hypothetical protein
VFLLAESANKPEERTGTGRVIGKTEPALSSAQTKPLLSAKDDWSGVWMTNLIDWNEFVVRRTDQVRRPFLKLWLLALLNIPAYRRARG